MAQLRAHNDSLVACGPVLTSSAFAPSSPSRRSSPVADRTLRPRVTQPPPAARPRPRPRRTRAAVAAAAPPPAGGRPRKSVAPAVLAAAALAAAAGRVVAAEEW